MDIAKDPINVLQITDTHLYAVHSGTLLKINTHGSLSAVLDKVSSNEGQIDLILATGDIAQDASPSSYQHFMKYMERFDAPVRWVPGNHDSGDVMQEVAGELGLSNKVELIGNWQFIMLDSSRINHVDGYLSAEELRVLETALKEAEADPRIEHSLVTLHHNPVPGSSAWMRDIGLRNDREFLALLRRSPTLRCVVYGHIHQALDFKLAGIRFFCTPSTCIQFKPEVIDFALDSVNPGYRRLKLFADGSIESEVIRIDGSQFRPDFASAGY
ncbi:MAG: 3',5'-cyclic-AMP phosphodiesterase [Gammaproteobacteria bacterium]|nr:3',5'-cyclic-AMP phosphodiesterase [Pseudomonadales bacterium]MCP5347890.1 3',5'-cyclic-AMP phosphodiesterase [Pseudomonadales bacterium]